MIRRHLLIVSALLTPSVVLAAELSISGNYGSPEACSLYAQGGGDAVYTGGGNNPDYVYVGDETDPILFASSREVLGFEWFCEPVNGTDLACGEAGAEASTPATITTGVNDTLTYTDENGPVVLRRC